MDTVGVRAGCTLTAYSDSSFNGNRIDIRADTYDRWAIFGLGLDTHAPQLLLPYVLCCRRING